MADAREHPFQQDIIDHLSANGWLMGGPAHYGRERALYPEDLIAFHREVHPDQWERFCKRNDRAPEKALLERTARELEKVGTLEVLRHSFKVPGARVRLCTFRPDHGMNADTPAQYRLGALLRMSPLKEQ